MCQYCTDLDSYEARHGHRCDEDCGGECEACGSLICRDSDDWEEVDKMFYCRKCAPMAAVLSLKGGTPQSLKECAEQAMAAALLLEDRELATEAVRLVMRDYLANRVSAINFDLSHDMARRLWIRLAQEDGARIEKEDEHGRRHD